MVEVDADILQIMILWLAIGVGCVAILPVTVPKLEYRCREVAILALPKENSLNLGKKAQKDVEEIGKSGSEASTSYMTTRVTLYPVDDAGQLYVPLDFGQTIVKSAEEENLNETKN